MTFDFFVKDNLHQNETFYLIPNENYLQRLPSFKGLWKASVTESDWSKVFKVKVVL